MINREIWPEDIQLVEKLVFIPVDRLYRKMLVIKLTVIYIILAACVIIVPSLSGWNAGWIVPAIVGVFSVAFAINLSLINKIHDIRGYALRDKDISYRKGLFFTTVTTIPFCKIQQVSVRMNPLSRLFGLYYLNIVNGSQAIMTNISISGLTKENAEKLKTLLINKANSDNE